MFCRCVKALVKHTHHQLRPPMIKTKKTKAGREIGISTSRSHLGILRRHSMTNVSPLGTKCCRCLRTPVRGGGVLFRVPRDQLSCHVLICSRPNSVLAEAKRGKGRSIRCRCPLGRTSVIVLLALYVIIIQC